VHDPFAAATFGIEYGGLLGRGTIPLPTLDGGFSRVDTPTLSQLALQIGAIHFFGRADLYVSIPVLSPGAKVGQGEDRRSVSASYLAATGLRLYPWPLRTGTLRPFMTTAVMLRDFRFANVDDPRMNPGRDKRFVLPVGIGLAYRGAAFIIDAQLEHTFFDGYDVRSGQVTAALSMAEAAAPSARLDLGGLRFTLGIKAVFDLSSGIVAPGFHEEEGRRLAARIKDGTASAIDIGVGPSTRIVSEDSSYFSRRPYLRRAYDDPPFPHVTLGYYAYQPDAELRLASRYITGSAEAFGARVEAKQFGVFLEALKFFEIGMYGFVPFVGLGAGYAHFSVTDSVAGSSTTHSADRVVLSVPFGWDIRVKPSDWWLLRTNLRWLPSARVQMAPHVQYDFAGLEFDFIQFLFYPERLF
jgi:hypothetical protein